MQGKLTLAVGFVAGYVLGSKAGRQRYEEIVAQARKVAGNQTVQSTAGVLQAQASDLVNKAKQSDVVAKAKQTVGRSSGGDTYTAPVTTAYGAETTTSGTDLFEPSTTTDPLSPTNPSSTNGSNP
jgi:hypothetical protein